MTEAAPIRLTQSDIAYLSRHHPMPYIQDEIDAGRFVIVDQKECEQNVNKNKGN